MYIDVEFQEIEPRSKMFIGFHHTLLGPLTEILQREDIRSIAPQVAVKEIVQRSLFAFESSIEAVEDESVICKSIVYAGLKNVIPGSISLLAIYIDDEGD
jgi:hypothetical protein